jgi:hypothetical protein
MNRKSYAHLASVFTVIATLFLFGACSSREDGSASPTALASRQLVVENFGKEVYALNSKGTDFISRCPDGSVWHVVVCWSYNDKKLEVFARTQIFPETVPMPAEEP